MIFIGTLILVDGLNLTQPIVKKPSVIELFIGGSILVFGLYMRMKTVKIKTYKDLKREQS